MMGATMFRSNENQARPIDSSNRYSFVNNYIFTISENTNV